MCRVIAVANQKGGCGKTATSINLGVGLVRLGQRVLAIDLDPQGHLTLGMGFPKNLRVTLKNMMENIIMGIAFDPREAILHHEEGLDIVPSNKLLTGMDLSLISVEEREMVLKEYLDLLRDEYDYILIDCMPSLGMLTINAMSAADSVLIPMQPQFYAADGLTELLKVIKGIKRNKQAVKMAYGEQMHIFENSIPRSEAIAETASEGMSIFAYDKRGRGAACYGKLAEEVLRHA